MDWKTLENNRLEEIVANRARLREKRGTLPPYCKLRGKPGNYVARPYGYYADDWPQYSWARPLAKEIQAEYASKYGEWHDED